MYFLLYNQEESVYKIIRDFTKTYNTFQTNIENKVKYSNIMALICIGIIVVSILVIIPLIFRISQRVIHLLRLFFELEPNKI